MSDNKKDDGWLSFLKEVAVTELICAILDVILNFMDGIVKIFYRILWILLFLAFLAVAFDKLGLASLFK